MVYGKINIVKRERDRDMLKFEITFEDGDYQVFHSTNHADPDRIAAIVVDHALCGSAQYAAFVEDQEREVVDFDDMLFFDCWDKAQRYIETKVSSIYKPGQMRVISSNG